MKITPKSEREIELETLLKESELIIDDSYLKTKDARKIMDRGYKLLMKCEELRKSRDIWRNKFEKLKWKIKTTTD